MFSTVLPSLQFSTCSLHASISSTSRFSSCRLTRWSLLLFANGYFLVFGMSANVQHFSVGHCRVNKSQTATTFPTGSFSSSFTGCLSVDVFPCFPTGRSQQLDSLQFPSGHHCFGTCGLSVTRWPRAQSASFTT